MLLRYLLFPAALVAAACLTGCGNSNGLYPVRGKVVCQGEPAVGAAVYLHRKNPADPLAEQVLQGIVAPDGSFEIAGACGKGASPGDYLVLVEWKEGAGKTPGRSPRLNAPDRFQGKYLDPNNPYFQVQVKPAKNVLPAFELQ